MCLTWIDSQGHITRCRFDFVGGRADVVTGRVDGNIEERQKPPLLRRDGHTLVRDAGEGGLYGVKSVPHILAKELKFCKQK